MYEIEKVTDLGSFFDKPNSIRFNGYCDELEDFLIKSYSKAKSCGCIFTDKLQNPSANNVEYLQNKLGVDFSLSQKFFLEKVEAWLPQLNSYQKQLLADSITKIFNELQSQGWNDSKLRNLYIKLMCWLYYKCMSFIGNLGSSTRPVIIYQGSYNTAELRFLELLAYSSCNVIVLDLSCDENTYKTVDLAENCSRLYKFSNAKSFPSSWQVSNLEKVILEKARFEELLGTIKTKPIIMDIPKYENSVFEVIQDCVTDNKVLRIQINGVDSNYLSDLYNLKGRLKNSIIVEGNVQPAKPNEVRFDTSMFKDTDDCVYRCLSSLVITNDNLFSVRQAFYNTLQLEKITSVSKIVGLWSICQRFIPLLNYGWFIILTDNLNPTSRFCLEFLKQLKVHILILNPSKSFRTLDLFKSVELNDTSSITQFPDSPSIRNIATVARKAEQEFTDVLFNGSIGIFKDRQYSNAEVLYLDTTFDEISILWNEELRLRQGFEVSNGVVQLPVIFGKVSGIPDGKLDKFYDTLKGFLTPNCIFRQNEIYSIQTNIFFAECVTHGKLDFGKIRKHRNYKYSYLKEEVQLYLFSRLQMLINLGIIKGFGKHGIENVIVSVAFNLPDTVLQALQDFDFTKRNPKFIYLSTSTEQISLEMSILINYLSLLGFDVLYIVPTGYNVCNEYLDKVLYKDYEFGNYCYNFNMTLAKSDKKSFMEKLFGRL